MSSLGAPAAFSRLVEQIYDCAIDPARWPVTLDVIRNALGFANAALTLQALPSGRFLMNFVTGVESPWLERMSAYASDVIDLWGGPAVAQSAPIDRPAVLSRMNPEAIAAGTNPYIVEWGRPQGLVDTLAIPLSRDGASIGTIGMGRHGSAGPIGETEIALATLLTPHLQRAVAIGRLLEGQVATRNTLAQVIDHLSMPVFILAVDRRILHRNAAAWRLPANDAGVSTRGERLSSPKADVARALESFVRHCHDGTGPRHHALGLPCHGVDGRTRALHVLPMVGSEVAPLLPGAVAAVFVATPRAATGASVAMIASLFALTPMEARVFSAVAEGATVAETARGLGTATSTVRSHLLQVFDKTGLRRQSELVRLASSLTLPVDDEAARF